MDLLDILGLCQEYNDMGWAVQEQLRSLVNGTLACQLNPNALKRMCPFFEKAAELTGDPDIDALLDEIYAHLEACQACQ